MFAILNSNIQLPINAFHSSGLAKKVFSDDMSGLEPVVFLEKGARVYVNYEFILYCLLGQLLIIHFRTTINHLTCKLQKWCNLKTIEDQLLMKPSHCVLQYIQFATIRLKWKMAFRLGWALT